MKKLLFLTMCCISYTLMAPPKKTLLSQQSKTFRDQFDIIMQVVEKEIELLKKENLWTKRVTLVATSVSKGGTLLYPKDVVDQEIQRIKATEGRRMGPQKCGLCTLQPQNRSNLLNHILGHYLPEDRPFQCPHCSAGFTRNDRCNEHIRKEHSE